MHKINFNKVVLSVSLFLFTYLSGLSVPAYRGTLNYALPDGNFMAIQLHGDEFFNYKTTTDGYLVDEAENGFLYYATIDSTGKIHPTAMRANNIEKRTNAERDFVSSLQQTTDLSGYNNKARAQKVAGIKQSAPLQRSFPINGAPKSLVILVNFSDKNFVTPNAKQAFTDLLNEPGYSTNGGTGSARDYFRDNSNGLFDPQFDVYGPYTLPNTLDSYGGNVNGSDKNPRQMVIDACALAAADSVDFAKYDTDNDGYIDNIFIYYAGFNEAEGAAANTIWPHRWVMANSETKFANKIIYNYACTSELKGTSGTKMCGIGTFVHEFGHVLGLPDYYATNGASHNTLSSWNVMDYGPYLNSGRTPPAYSAYDRFFLGWHTPVELKTPLNVTLDTLTTSNTSYLITQKGNHNLKGANPSPVEFFTIENRQQKGWDQYLPGHGMLITRIYYNAYNWYSNSVNNTASAMGVDIMEADGIASNSNLAGDPFPGTSNVKSFTPVLRSGTIIEKPLLDIRETQGIITFKFMGGPFSASVAPVAINPTDISQTKFTANWEQIYSATAYLLDVFSINGQDTIYVSGFKAKNVGKVLSYSVSGLNEGTAYFYRVKATNGTNVSVYSNTVSLKTTVYTFDMFRPEALTASTVQANSFTANWAELNGAEFYLIDVYKKAIGKTLVSTTIDFSAASTPSWTSNSSDTYTSYYGKAAPSLQLSANGQYISTSLSDKELRSAQFWYRGVSSSSNNNLKISGSADGVSWNELKTIMSVPNEAKIASLSSAELKNIRALKIEFIKIGLGYMAIDDIQLQTDKDTVIYLDGYQSHNVGKRLSYEISGLEAQTNYFYTVQATKGNVSSAKSNEINVFTSLLSGTSNTTDINRKLAWVDNGKLFIKNISDHSVPFYLYDMSGRQVLKGEIQNSQAVNVSILPKGIYAIQINHEVYKILLK
jgi:M6 family metalloprotease-like protein